MAVTATHSGGREVRVATTIPMNLRMAVGQKILVDRTTISRVIRVCLEAYVNGALPDEYREKIVGYRIAIAPTRRAKELRRAAGRRREE